jgi:hypothetical protein
MALKVFRKPDESYDWLGPTSQRYSAYLHVWNVPGGDASISLGFSTKGDDLRRGSSFRMTIPATDFQALAMAMVDANPEAAAKAFGQGMVKALDALHPSPKPEPRKIKIHRATDAPQTTVPA